MQLCTLTQVKIDKLLLFLVEKNKKYQTSVLFSFPKFLSTSDIFQQIIFQQIIYSLS